MQAVFQQSHAAAPTNAITLHGAAHLRPLRLRMTAELKKGQYVYYRCTAQGHCGNTYMRQEELLRLLGKKLTSNLPRAYPRRDGRPTGRSPLRESQADKERFSRTRLMRLQQQQLQVQAKIDRAYDDRLSGAISEEMWTRKAAEWEAEDQPGYAEGHGPSWRTQAETYATVTGLRILELAKKRVLHESSIRTIRGIRESLLKMVLSNCTFDRGSLCPAYNKPFEIFAHGGNESGDWLLGLDSNQQPSG